MIRHLNWKHFGLALFLTIVICLGFMIYNQWDILRFKQSLEEDTTQSPKTIQTKAQPGTTQKQTKLTPSESDSQNNKIKVEDNENNDEKDANLYDFLDYLDQLEEEEVVKLIENLDLDDDEKKVIAELAKPDPDLTEDFRPSNMIVDLMESGVASLSDLIEIMEESSTVLPDNVQHRFEPVLHTLREMKQNGGHLIFHRPPDTSNYMLIMINPTPSQRQQAANTPINGGNFIYEIPSNDPSKESIFLHQGNSIIID